MGRTEGKNAGISRFAFSPDIYSSSSTHSNPFSFSTPGGVLHGTGMIGLPTDSSFSKVIADGEVARHVAAFHITLMFEQAGRVSEERFRLDLSYKP